MSSGDAAVAAFEKANPYAVRARDLCDHNKRAGNVGGPPPESEDSRRARLDEARIYAELALALETYRGRLR